MMLLRLSSLLSLVLLLACHHRHIVVSADDHVETVIDVGNFRIEGSTPLPEDGRVAAGLPEGTWVLVTEFYHSGVLAVNIEDGSVEQLVPGVVEFGERGGLGVWYFGDGGVAFVAGGGVLQLGLYTPRVYAYDITTGDSLAACEPEEAQFMNDIVVVEDKAYVTDTLRRDLLVMDAPALAMGQCDYYRIPLSDPFPDPDGNPTANGILPYLGGLLVTGFSQGSLYWIDLGTNETTTILPPGTMTTPDGLCNKDNVLYVNENGANKVSAWNMDGTNFTKLGEHTTEDYDSPTSCAIVPQGYVYSTNARFNSLGELAPGENTTQGTSEVFTVVGVDAAFFNDTSGPSPTPGTTPEPSPSPGTTPGPTPTTPPSNTSGGSSLMVLKTWSPLALFSMMMSYVNMI